MSYEVVDKDLESNDVFTGGAEGRYAKAKAPTADTTDKKIEKKKKAPKIEAEVKPTEEQPAEAVTEKPKTKKKPRATDENVVEAAASETNGDTSVKPKKKRAPKIEGERENIDPAVSTTEVSPPAEEPVKKKKAKAPKPAPVTEDSIPTDSVAPNAYEEPIEDIVAPKVKKAKKPKQTLPPPAISADEEMIAQGTDANNYGGLPVNPAMFDGNPMGTAEIPTESKQLSEYEQAITNAFSNLGNKINFTEYVGGDVWSIIHPPKTARMPNRTGIRKIIPGGSNRQDPRLTNGRGSLNPPVTTKGGFFNRMKSTVTTLVRDENNLIFGEQSNYDVAYFEEEEEEGDTDNLHRYAQKLRELEDADREVNPEYVVIRGGKTVFGVQETDAEGKTILSKRKPIYDRAADQEVDGVEETNKPKLFGRLRHAFAKAKDRDSKGENSPKPSTGTPDTNEKSSKRKSSKKQNEELAMTPGKDPVDY